MTTTTMTTHDDDDHEHDATITTLQRTLQHDHNLVSAYLHVLADALTSVLAIVALLAAKYFGLTWMDPFMGIVGAVLVARWSFGLLQGHERGAARPQRRARRSAPRCGRASSGATATGSSTCTSGASA